MHFNKEKVNYMERIQYIDRLKGLAIFLVVMGHVYNGVLLHTGSIYEFISSFHVPLLFFLSGMVIFSPPQLGKCIRKSFSFFVPFCVIGGAFALFIGSPFTELFKSQYNLGYWYLLVLSFFYITLIPFRLNQIKSKYGHICIDILLIIGIHTLFVSVYSFWQHSISYQLMTYYYFFAGAHLLRKNNLIQFLGNCNSTLSLFMILSIASIVTIQFLHFKLSIIPHAYDLIALFMILTLIFMFRERTNSISFLEKQLGFWGRHILDIYIYHYFIRSQIHLSVLGDWFAKTENSFIEMVFVILISTLIVYLSSFVGVVIKRARLLQLLIYTR